MADRITIYTDGAARGNPGPSASGYSVYNGRLLLTEDCVYNGVKTNNYAEYNSMILALQWCTDNISDAAGAEIELYSDSELAVKQLNGSYKVKADPLIAMYREVVALSNEFRSVRFKNLRRSDPNISRVDKRLNLLLDELAGKA